MTTSQPLKIICPTLHFYHYVLRNGLNDSDEQLKERRDNFTKNLHKITSHLISKNPKYADGFVRLIPPEKDVSPWGSLLDLTLEEIPEECKEENEKFLSLGTGIITSRLALYRLNDTYLLRFTSYIPSEKGPQDLTTFGNLSEHLSTLNLELGQTAILAGTLSKKDYQGKTSREIAAQCLRLYYPEPIADDDLIKSDFLGSPFYLYPRRKPVETINGLSLESTHLMGVILYEDPKIEKKANEFYNTLQTMILSYHKINFFYSQSRALKKLLSQKYQEIEQQTKDYSQSRALKNLLSQKYQEIEQQTKDYSQSRTLKNLLSQKYKEIEQQTKDSSTTDWNKESLKQLPYQSLEFYRKLSFLSDQEKTLRVNLYNYRKRLQQIEEHTGEKLGGFFGDFIDEAEHYLKQIKTTIGFVSPGLQLYDKLMLSVQTQVSIDDERIQKQQSDQQQKLGQLLTGSCAAIAVGQILNQAITFSLSQYIDKDPSQPPSVTSLWVGAFVTIFLSISSGLLVSQLVYRWFTKPKSDETTQRRWKKRLKSLLRTIILQRDGRND